MSLQISWVVFDIFAEKPAKIDNLYIPDLPKNDIGQTIQSPIMSRQNSYSNSSKVYWIMPWQLAELIFFLKEMSQHIKFPNRLLLLNKVLKMTRIFFFSIKPKMLQICVFYNRFSILDEKNDLEWVPDLLAPHGPVFQA